MNSIITAAYWLVGRRIVEYEQGGAERAEYGAELIRRLSVDLTALYGRGFSVRNLRQMRAFYLAWEIRRTPSAESVTPEATLATIASSFPLPWSAYVQLLSVRNEAAREFYEAEAIAGGWTIRQLRRQIDSEFYERTALSYDKEAMLLRGRQQEAGDIVSPAEAFKDPYILEFLGLKDEYSEADLEEALIRHLEEFLMELGGDFCFVGRQRRLRIGDEWYRVDLLFYNRRLRCLVVIDLKLGRFTHADAGQMNLYLNYARALGHCGREPAGGIDTLRPPGRRRSALCTGRFGQYDIAGRISHRFTLRGDADCGNQPGPGTSAPGQRESRPDFRSGQRR